MHIFHILDLGTPINIDLLIGEFNRLQSSFKLIKFERTFSFPNDKIDRKHFFKILKSNIASEIRFVISITPKALDNNFFSDIDEDYKLAIISIDQSEIYHPPFRIEDYLKSEIILSILTMLAKMNIDHYDTRGCLFDFCGNKKDIVIKLHSGAICADCKARLMYYGITEAEVASAQKILWNICKDFISLRVSRGCPIGYKICKEFHEIQREYSEKNIFLAISFGDEFKDMIDHLKTKFAKHGYNLKEVIGSIENKNILCKICRTIQTCKYGIAEFSGFRHNVSYEFGLMQAFGLDTIGIIKSEKRSEFEKNMSDMKGVEIIPYESISGDLFKKLERFIK